MLISLSSCPFSHATKVACLLLISFEECISEALKGLLDISGLQGADLEEFKTDASSECHAVLGTYCNTVLQINFIGNNDTEKGTTLILLLDLLEPLSEEMECVRVGNIVNQHDHVSFSEYLEGNLLEDVLSSNIDKMKLDPLIRLSLNIYILDIVFAALSHHIIVIECLLADLIDKAGLPHCWLSCYDHSCTQNRHILILF